LLDFARAGGHAEPGARTDVRSVLSDLWPSLAADAERAHLELVVDTVPPVMVGCSPGVYLSMVGNLTRNAIKYMGDSKVRRITVRVTDERTQVRTEVVDTGPGIPDDMLPRLFELWFRGNHTGGPAGFGLGLATVKRLAEGHGGSVGVRSSLGAGSTFWFLLPHAGVVTADDIGGPSPVEEKHQDDDSEHGAPH
jgi:signal transduction histidine kinase